LPISKYMFAIDADKTPAYDFLKKIEKIVAADKKSTVRVWTGLLELKLNDKDEADRCKDIVEIRKTIEATQTKLDELSGVTPVHAPFFKVSSIYLKEIGNYASYYREALRYLGCEDLNNIPLAEKTMQAVLLGFAALLGEDVYNFGELLAHPILKALEGTDEGWLVDVLFAFNSGDLNKFYQYKANWSKWSDIEKNQGLLLEKIRLLCVMEMALARPAKQRLIRFDELAQKAQIDVTKVEFLVMKALSKGLVKGSIDQVDNFVNITWVQPRVLNSPQIMSMSGRVGEWATDVCSMERVVSDNAKEILLKA